MATQVKSLNTRGEVKERWMDICANRCKNLDARVVVVKIYRAKELEGVEWNSEQREREIFRTEDTTSSRREGVHELQ